MKITYLNLLPVWLYITMTTDGLMGCLKLLQVFEFVIFWDDFLYIYFILCMQHVYRASTKDVGVVEAKQSDVFVRNDEFHSQARNYERHTSANGNAIKLK